MLWEDEVSPAPPGPEWPGAAWFWQLAGWCYAGGLLLYALTYPSH